MLELRPSCEQCNTPLPPASAEARICSFECTFCAGCVERVLFNVCPNCGGVGEAWLGQRPPTTKVTHRPRDPAAHAAFAAAIRDIPPHER